MAGGAGWSPVISRLPSIRGGIPLPTVAFGIVDMAVFAVIENLNIGMIRCELKEETSLEQVVELAGGFQPDYLTDCIVLERLGPIGRELIPVLYEKNYLGTAVRNFDVIKIYPNSSILPKYFCLDTPQNKALSLNQ